jgi:hypothetical protein
VEKIDPLETGRRAKRRLAENNGQHILDELGLCLSLGRGRKNAAAAVKSRSASCDIEGVWSSSHVSHLTSHKLDVSRWKRPDPATEKRCDTDTTSGGSTSIPRFLIQPKNTVFELVYFGANRFMWPATKIRFCLVWMSG